MLCQIIHHKTLLETLVDVQTPLKKHFSLGGSIFQAVQPVPRGPFTPFTPVWSQQSRWTSACGRRCLHRWLTYRGCGVQLRDSSRLKTTQVTLQGNNTTYHTGRWTVKTRYTQIRNKHFKGQPERSPSAQQRDWFGVSSVLVIIPPLNSINFLFFFNSRTSLSFNLWGCVVVGHCSLPVYCPFIA